VNAGTAGAAVRASAAEVVDAVLRNGRSLDDALFAAEEKLQVTEHALLRMLSFGALRSYWQLQSWIDVLLERPLSAKDKIVESLLLIGLLQISDSRIPDHAAVSATVEAARLLRKPKHAGLVNAILRRFMRDQLADSAPAGEVARFNHPAWLIDAIRADWPDDWRQILQANNERAPMWLRVNNRRVATDRYLQRLSEHGIVAQAFDASAATLLLERAVPVAALPGFTTGEVSVQDAAAQLAAPWLLAGGLGGRILDACSAPGGKSAHLKELGGSAIELTAIDNDPVRLNQVEANFERLGLSATIAPGDASNSDEWYTGQAFDGILLDAPCSASGVIRRHPDIKHLRRPSDIGRLAKLQGEILRALWPLLLPGGRLLYVTCSVFTEENNAVIGAFLATHDNARETDMLHNNNIRDVMRRKSYGYQVLPGTRGMDGFYFACLEKVS
jgi:16S rRNA (cytosine967-C5)-methyltransferase